MIDIEASIEGRKTFLTFVYGDPVIECREYVWERLTRKSLVRTGAWFMIGDFNEITGNDEKKGGRKRQESSFLPFRTMIANCGMIEFPYKGNPMSWVGFRRSGKVQCRLDRAIGNEEWHHLFSHTNVKYLKLWGSDHRPVLARIQSRDVRVQRSFKFDKRWLGKDGLEDAIKDGWGISSSGRGASELHFKISNVRRAISRWKRANPTNSAKKIEDIKALLETAQTEDGASSEEILNLKWNLCSAYREEELYWKQMSRVLWLKEGDRNTKFFHASTKQRRGRNRIIKLRNPAGGWVEDDEGVERVATTYFQNLFTTSSPGNPEDALRYINAQVTPDINTSLTRPVLDTEIRKAIDEINPEKAPGPDGMTGTFYQAFGDIVAEEVIHTVKSFFASGSFDTRLNQTNICLIPKTDRPKDMTEFRPISLCNVSYKIISKIMCRRLKKFLPKLISETQSAFVARRLISDNILVAQEIFHAMRTNPICKAKFVAIKTDMSKAYDRVE